MYKYVIMVAANTPIMVVKSIKSIFGVFSYFSQSQS